MSKASIVHSINSVCEFISEWMSQKPESSMMSTSNSIEIANSDQVNVKREKLAFERGWEKYLNCCLTSLVIKSSFGWCVRFSEPSIINWFPLMCSETVFHNVTFTCSQCELTYWMVAIIMEKNNVNQSLFVCRLCYAGGERDEGKKLLGLTVK